MGTNNKVFVVDDEASVQRVCTMYLEAEGFSVKTFSSARNIVEDASQEQPDVIVMDLNMPDTDGFSAARAIRSGEKTAKIPILILSARDDLESKSIALLNCNADDYVTKPFDPGDLVLRITRLCMRNKVKY